MRESKKIRIIIDNGLLLEAEIPSTMTAMEWAGLSAKLGVIKTIAKNNIMLKSTKTAKNHARLLPLRTKYHRWTTKETDFIKNHRTMNVDQLKKHLHLEHLSDTSVESKARKV